MRLQKTIFLLVWTTFAAFLYGQTETQLCDNKIYRELRDEISGVRAKDYVIGISRYNRTDGAFENTEYEKAVAYVMGILEDFGVANVKLHSYAADGIKTYGTWRSNPGFRIHSAKLYVTKPLRAKWCDSSQTTVALMPYSNGKGVTEAEVVYVGRGTSDKDYEGKNVQGKIVFAEHGDAAMVMRQAVQKRGAAGIVMGSSLNRRLAEFPTLVEVNRLYLSGEETKNSTWGFSLSRDQTETLKNLLEVKRKVIMRAEVFAETFSGHMPIISAVVEGSTYPEQEVIYIAHLDHYKPGANDNASGSAGLVEIATTMTKLIEEGKITRPLRTIRFLWVPEWEGTAAYIEENRNTAKRGIIGINMDMIGANLQNSQSYLSITKMPLSRPSFLDALIAYYASLVDRMNVTTGVGSNSTFNYRIVDYMGGSDHMMFCDAQIGVPSTMLVHLGDRFWHTSFDVPDNIDPTEMERSILLGAFLGWTAASYDEKNVNSLVELTHHSLVERIESATMEYLARLEKSGKTTLHREYRDSKAYFDYVSEFAIKSLDSILGNLPRARVDSTILSDRKNILGQYLDLQRQRIESSYKVLCREKGTEPQDALWSDLEKECSEIYPKRLIAQSLSYWLVDEILREMGLSPFMSYDMLWEMLNYADGKHNLIQLRNAACAQFREIGIKPVKDVFVELKERGWISF
ncbi:MAG: DUF4910 domain-containing protein [Candidatus Aminicenantes bacterium]|nr:DUF4910 domain-containing protein [Candidatus Aminicenantes bacterium]